MNKTDKWGFLPDTEELERCGSEQLTPGRVIQDSRGLYKIAAGDEIIRAEVSGAFRYRAVLRSDYPAAGDWVAFRSDDGTAMIERVLPRRTCFSRKTAGDRTDEQIMAANIDVVFIVFGLDGGRNFAPGSIERYATLAWNSGATPVIVLNKADLCPEEGLEQAVLTAENAAPGVEVKTVSAATGDGVTGLCETLAAGTTIALAGPSGVGKSSLVNRLAGSGLQRTGSQREADRKGRHTTTHRELFRLDSGIILVDGPGLRELQLWGAADAADETFSDIAEFAAECRFSDCSHQGEPGCAVQQAVAEGALEAGRYERFLDQKRELAYLNRRQDRQAADDETRRWKQIKKSMKAFYKNNPK